MEEYTNDNNDNLSYEEKSAIDQELQRSRTFLLLASAAMFLSSLRSFGSFIQVARLYSGDRYFDSSTIISVGSHLVFGTCSTFMGIYLVRYANQTATAHTNYNKLFTAFYRLWLCFIICQIIFIVIRLSYIIRLSYLIR